jgi:thioredoxin reductase (NADPH)
MLTFDTIIVGGGPAGASCALWLKLLGFQPCIIEHRTRLGGLQNDSPYLNEWIAPLTGFRGREVAQNIHSNLLSRSITCYLSTSVHSVAPSADCFVVGATDGCGDKCISAPYVVLASGVRPADGGLSAGSNLLIGPGTQIVETDFSRKSVAILGGGDNAFENYHFIREKGAAEVHIYARTIKARREFLETTPVEHVSIGKYDVDPDTMTVSDRSYDIIVVLYGWTPSLDFMHNVDLARDSNGFVVTDYGTAETSISNVFAIGEVAQRMHPCCVTSMADGVVAAKEIQRRIEANAKDAFIAAVRKARLR